MKRPIDTKIYIEREHGHDNNHRLLMLFALPSNVKVFTPTSNLKQMFYDDEIR